LLKNEESLPEILTLLPKVIRSANKQRLTLYHCVPVETLGVHILQILLLLSSPDVFF